MTCPRRLLFQAAPLEAPVAALGLVLYLDLLAPYVLLDYLRVFHNVLADAHLFLDHRMPISQVSHTLKAEMLVVH